jgi:UDP-2-acetamido-3-amino-2,3-dideoxy-glucuronate N-acetyltransferase
MSTIVTWNTKSSLESEIKLRSKTVSEVSRLAKIGKGTKVWGHSKVCDEVQIGENSIIGRSVYVGPGVQIGHNCKIQNNALLYEPATLGNGVFIGPGVILTNDLNPRAVSTNLELKTQVDWDKQGVNIEEGASIGAGAICIAPIRIGKWALIGAGSVVTKDVPNYALMIGNPARQVAWVGMAGFKLVPVSDFRYQCPKTGQTYRLQNNELEIELNRNVESVTSAGNPNAERI